MQETLLKAVDRLEIGELIVKYAKARDITDPALYRQIFADDAQIALPNGKVLSDGLSAILRTVANDQKRFNPGVLENKESWATMRHLVTNINIELDGDKAGSDYYVMTLANHPTLQRPEIVSQARNVDRFEKRDGRWLIVRSTLHYDWGNDEMAKLLQIGPHTPAEFRH